MADADMRGDQSLERPQGALKDSSATISYDSLGEGTIRQSGSQLSDNTSFFTNIFDQLWTNDFIARLHYSNDAQTPNAIPELFGNHFEPALSQQVPTSAPIPPLSPFDSLPVSLAQTSAAPAEAVVLETPDGKFFCSQLGCDATYLRVGDCRRHLKKHNGPFFACDQHGCNMEFYRHDKLRAHLKQGHGVIIAAPRRGRRGAN
ncbi:hypothetical protein OPT61_g6226 [Boeremia exigua]|uniref:Uncharacterized protein n=1 Tax=Boeremia exigua TaxID=749465 RepID=A0ACC2I7G6_9PLEO|nr:hypothetical protein OPT61_g6226 [Boeremia exigua]